MNSISARIIRVAACGAIVLSTACSSKVDDCNQVIDIVNKTVTEMGALEAGLNNDDPAVIAPAVDKMVAVAGNTVTSLKALQVKTPEVVKFSGDYQNMVNELSAIYTALKNETVAAAATVKSLEATNQKLQDAMTKIGTACSSDATAAEECQKVSGVLQTLPSDPTADVAGVTAKVAELKALGVANAALAPAVADVAASFEALAKAVTELKAVEDKVNGATKKAEELTATESKLVDGFNAFCQAP